MIVDVLNGPFGRASSLSDPDSGEHYRVVLAEGWCGSRKNSRMDAHATADEIRDLAEADPAWALSRRVRPCGVVRVIPRTTSLKERMEERTRASHP